MKSLDRRQSLSVDIWAKDKENQAPAIGGQLKTLISACVSGALLLSFSTWAQSTTTSPATNAETSNVRIAVPSLSNKKYEDTREITDAKLRADAGSLSKYSLKFNLSYYGPTLGDLSAKDQPNPDGSVGVYSTALSGTVGMRYRTSPSSSISAGTGVKAVYPLHGMERLDAQTPYLNYDMTSRTESGIQMRNSPGVSVVTLPEYQRIGEVATVSYDFSSVYNINTSKVAVGLDANVSYFIYNRAYEPADGKASRAALQIYPTAKYNFSDKLNVTTSTALTWLSPRYRNQEHNNEFILLNKVVTQRLGLGYAWSRDVYLFPYVTIFPTRAAWDTTTMNFSTVFSVL